jgi:hypothetical protein
MKNGKSMMCVKWVFCMTYTNNATMKEKCKEEGGEDESEIYTAMRRSVNNSQKKVAITNYFSKQTLFV